MADEEGGMKESHSQESVAVPQENFENTKLGRPVGFDSISSQIQNKFLKRGFEFNILVAGQTGLGKSTFINTLFATHLLNIKAPNEKGARKTVSISSRSHLVEEKGVKLRLTGIDTPGFGEQLDNTNTWDVITRYIRDQYNIYYTQDNSVPRKRFIRDPRVHVCIYFIPPNSISGLRSIDVQAMKNLCEVVNLVPVIAKSDTLSISEREALKKKIWEEIKFHKIEVYPTHYDDYDTEDMNANKIITSLIPFAVIGSEKMGVVNGKNVPVRNMGWAVINVEDQTHCEFSQLKNFLIKTHMQDMIEVTHQIHYENFRKAQLGPGKEKKEKKKEKEKKK